MPYGTSDDIHDLMEENARLKADLQRYGVGPAPIPKRNAGHGYAGPLDFETKARFDRIERRQLLLARVLLRDTCGIWLMENDPVVLLRKEFEGEL